MVEGRYLVVVSVLEGRNFPKRGKHQLVVEAKFDGELLATDAVEHGEYPDVTQELAWELDKKGLHQHRMQRTSIKVQCYALDPLTTVREAVGYVVLDLRSASTQQSPKWHHLLHSKYAKSKPEIRLSLYIDEDNKGGDQSNFKAREAPARPGESSSTLSGVDARTLKPILNEAEGFYQIGPRDKCSEHFVLSVTVAFATNLPQLVPTNIPLPSSGFFFYYSLLGNDVTNEAFFDLLNPTFPAERASVRLRSSVEALRMFFSSQPGIEIHICCGDQSLGSAEIPLVTLLKAGSTEIYMKPVTVEGAFPLEAPNRMKSQLPVVSEQLRPSVGVAVALRKEDQAMTGLTPTKDVPQQTSEPKEPATQDVTNKPKEKTEERRKPEAVPKQKAKKEKPKPKLQGKKQAPRGPSPPGPPTHDGSYTDTFESSAAPQNKTDDNVSSISEDEKRKAKKKGGTVSPQPKVNLGEEPQVTPILPPGDIPTEIPVIPLEPTVTGLPAVPHLPPMPAPHPVASTSQPRHYCCSIDLRSVKLTEIHHQFNVFLRYTYPFFGSAAPILTHPPIEARRGAEVLVPQSFCAFDFATTPQQIADTFNSVPLVVEVWDREKNKAQSNILGAVQLFLFNVLQEQRSRAVHSNGTSGWRQVINEILPIMTIDGPSTKLGELMCVVSLEDWGPVNTQSLGNQQTTSQSSTTDAPGAPPGGPVAPMEPRETVEYQAALELEMWKEQQEQLFENQLKDKEAQYMKALSEEWKRRDKEREILMQKRISEYQQMEEKMRKTISDLNRRDKQLAANEQEVMRLRTDLKREHERKMLEMREASRRMKEDCDHQVQLEKTKTKELEDYILRLKNQLGEAEAKQQALGKEFGQYREQQNTKPEVRLQSEINLLTLEKVELERKLDSATKSKVHYKQQWTRALKELARLKQKEQAAAKAQLKRQQQELEHMRLRYLAAEEKEVVKTEKKELEEIRQQLQTLKETELAKSSQGETLMPLPPDQEDPDDEHITRLIEERDTLLRTGVYTTEDRIITELDRQIREAIARRGGNVR